MNEKDYQDNNKAFMVYKDWEEFVNALESNEEAGELFKALFAFAKRGERQQFEGALKMAFLVMTQQISRDGEKWVRRCERNSENARKRWDKKKATECDRIKSYAKNADTDTDKDTDKDKDTDTDIDIDINTRLAEPHGSEPVPARSKPAPVRHKYGEYKNVLLTDTELETLKSELPGNYQDYIERLSEYMASKGKKYKNHLVTIRSWARKDKGEQQSRPERSVNNYDRDILEVLNEKPY